MDRRIVLKVLALGAVALIILSCVHGCEALPHRLHDTDVRVTPAPSLIHSRVPRMTLKEPQTPQGNDGHLDKKEPDNSEPSDHDNKILYGDRFPPAAPEQEQSTQNDA